VLALFQGQKGKNAALRREKAYQLGKRGEVALGGNGVKKKEGRV